MPRFSDIQPFISKGDYEVNVALKRLERTLQEMAEDYKLELNPDFQRGRVWSEAQQISYVEFLLRGGATARVIYFNSPAFSGGTARGDLDDTILCVDGLQRLTAILAFLRNQIRVFGYFYNEYDDELTQDHTLRFNVNSLLNRKDVLQWYLDFNSGGTVHSEEELARVRALLEAEQNKTT